MARNNPTPIITHTEILCRAIRSFETEIEEKQHAYAGIISKEEIDEFTAHLRAKLDAVKTLYRMETGTDYD